MNLDDLAAKARAATAGPWRWGDWSARFGTAESVECMLTLERNLTRGDDPTPYKCTRADGRHQVLSVEASDAFGNNGENDKAYIAAASPSVILALIARLRAAEAYIDAAEHCRHCRHCGEGPCCDLCAAESALSTYRATKEQG